MSIFGYMKRSKPPHYPKIKFEVEYLDETNNSTPAVKLIVKGYEDDSYKAEYYFDSEHCLIDLIVKLAKGALFLNIKARKKLANILKALALIQ